jgi:hypothetical protein
LRIGSVAASTPYFSGAALLEELNGNLTKLCGS